jgi:hypothetical protein
VEDGSSWLPAGLEGSGSEPDDGASQRDMRQRPSDVDAMGQDEHRKVVGQGHGVSRGRSLVYHGVFVVLLVGGYLGLHAAVEQLDKAPARSPDKAPWSKAGAPQLPLGGSEPNRPSQKGPTRFQ